MFANLNYIFLHYTLCVMGSLFLYLCKYHYLPSTQLLWPTPAKYLIL